MPVYKSASNGGKSYIVRPLKLPGFDDPASDALFSFCRICQTDPLSLNFGAGTFITERNVLRVKHCWLYQSKLPFQVSKVCYITIGEDRPSQDAKKNPSTLIKSFALTVYVLI